MNDQPLGFFGLWKRYFRFHHGWGGAGLVRAAWMGWDDARFVIRNRKSMNARRCRRG